MRLTSAGLKESKGAYNFIRSRLGNGVKLTLAKNAHYKSRDFLCVLQFVSAIRDASIHSGGSFLKEYSSNDVPSDDQILRTLSSQEIDHINGEFQRLFDQILTETKRLASPIKKDVIIAIDGTNWFYYGKDAPGVVNTKPQRGTSRAYHYEVAQIADNRFPLVITVAMTTPLTDRIELLRELVMRSLQRVNVSIFLLDRGYFAIETFQMFKDIGRHFIMPLPLTEHNKEEILRIFYSKEGGGFTGKITIGNKKKSVDLNLVLVENEHWFDTSRPIYERVYAYLTSMEVNDEDRLKIANYYRRRWRIETGHRTKNEFLINTTSKNYRVRLFLFLLAQIMRNLWILYDLLIRSQTKWSWDETSPDTILDRISSIAMRLILMRAESLVSS
jgi:hypothetical protein